MKNYPLYSPKPFVRVTAKVPGGRQTTIWAEKLRDGVYRQVNSEGEYGHDGKIRLFIGAPGDIVREQSARLNRKYGELEVVEPGWEDLRSQ